MKSMMYALMMALVLFSSCEENEKAEEALRVTMNFKFYFYRDGEVCANKLEMCGETEWAVAAENSGRACEVFKDITGKAAPLTEDYKYNFTFPDESGHIKLEREQSGQRWNVCRISGAHTRMS